MHIYISLLKERCISSQLFLNLICFYPCSLEMHIYYVSIAIHYMQQKGKILVMP